MSGCYRMGRKECVELKCVVVIQRRCNGDDSKGGMQERVVVAVRVKHSFIFLSLLQPQPPQSPHKLKKEDSSWAIVTRLPTILNTLTPSLSRYNNSTHPQAYGRSFLINAFLS